MNQDSQHSWTAPPSGTDEEFNFLDFEQVDLDFSQGETVTEEGDMHNDTMDINRGNYPQDVDTSQMSTPVSTAYPPGDPLSEMSIQQQLFSPHISQPPQGTHRHSLLANQPGQLSHYFRHGVVPPTPNTVEMQGAQVHSFTDPMALGMYETGKAQDQMVFTPLVSPAFQLQDYNQSNEYFSPLTSPALQPQQEYPHHAAPNTSLVESERKDYVATVNPARKAKRRIATTGKDPVHTIRSSPAMKAQQKRHSTSGKTPKEIAEIIAGMGVIQQRSPALNASKGSVLHSQSNSETGSISPEPLSEVLMPPPAAPRSAGQEQSIQASTQALQPTGPGDNAPATPASLFGIQDASLKGPASQDASKTQVSASANSKVSKRSAPSTPSMLALDCQLNDKAPAAKSIRISDSAPASAGLKSPQAGEPGSPGGGAASSATKDANYSTRNKKRSSSSHVSPALRPRISPSIKPLLPGGGGMVSETTALLLANKSNYERIVDGSASSLGVNYPAQLSENLTSKRTSHKLAEQGRRNRINTALQEIQTLIPETIGKDNGDGSSGSNASKAKTVENAIEYIKQLRSELQEARADLRDARCRLVESDTSQVETESGTKSQEI